MSDFRPERIFAALASNDVDYVAVGGVALIAHGVVRATPVVDLIPDHAVENLERLAAAIGALHGTPYGEAGTIVTSGLLARDANMRFLTDAGQLDVLGAAIYRPLYPDLRARSITAELDGVEIRVVSRNDLIRLKAGSGSDRDLLDVGDLLAQDEWAPPPGCRRDARRAPATLREQASLLLEAGERMVLAQVLGEQRDGEVDLAAAGRPDQPLADQRVAVDRDAALAAGAVGAGDLGRAVGGLAQGGHRGQVALLGVGGQLRSGCRRSCAPASR